MDIGDAARTLAWLAAAYPTFPLRADTEQVYLAALAERVEHAADAADAARAWVYAQDRFPTVSQLLAACRVETQRRTHTPLALVAGDYADVQRSAPSELLEQTRSKLRPRPKGDTE